MGVMSTEETEETKRDLARAKLQCKHIINRGKPTQRRCPTGTRRAHGYCKAHEKFAIRQTKAVTKRSKVRCAFSKCSASPCDRRGYCGEHSVLLTKETPPCTGVLQSPCIAFGCSTPVGPSRMRCGSHAPDATVSRAEALFPARFANASRFRGSERLLVEVAGESVILSVQHDQTVVREARDGL